MVEDSPKTEGHAKKSGLFGSHEKKEDPMDKIKVLANEITTVNRRTRMIEEHISNLRRKVQVNEQNMLSDAKKNVIELRTTSSDVTDLRRLIQDIENKMLIIIKELKLCAKKSEVTTLQKYIDMWEPINFVTRKEVEKIVGEVLEEGEWKSSSSTKAKKK